MLEQIKTFATIYPRTSIIIISLVITFLSMLITKKMTDQDSLKGIKERQKEIQKEIKEKNYSSEDRRFISLQQEMMELTASMIKHSFRPLIVTFIPFAILFYFLRTFYSSLVGNSWFWYYLIPGLLVSPLYKKILKIV